MNWFIIKVTDSQSKKVLHVIYLIISIHNDIFVLANFGIRLFKSVAGLLNTCLSIIISHESFLKEKSSEILYMLKYKPTSIILKIFSRIILSNIVNLSILDTYADPDLLTFLNHIFTIIISLPTEAITSYMKVIKILII